MYEFCCDYVKPKYSEKVRLCYMETNSFIVYIKRWYKRKNGLIKILQKVLNHRLDRPFLKGKNKQIIGLIKYGLGRKIMTKFARVKAKKYSY